MRCPGQDPRYWTGEIVFEVPCPRCGQPVEFFRDEASARCPVCKHRFANPKRDIACAQWCPHAQECLGSEFVPPASTELGEGAIASSLLQAARDLYGTDLNRMAKALVAFQHVRTMVGSTTADPPVAFALTLFWQFVMESNEAEQERLQKLRQALSETKLSPELQQRVLSLFEAACKGNMPQELEWLLCEDALCLAEAGWMLAQNQPEQVNKLLENLRTPQGQERARSVFGRE